MICRRRGGERLAFRHRNDLLLPDENLLEVEQTGQENIK
jgi:hypothetical protein